jgi:hypothetical protein
MRRGVERGLHAFFIADNISGKPASTPEHLRGKLFLKMLGLGVPPFRVGKPVSTFPENAL